MVIKVKKKAKVRLIMGIFDEVRKKYKKLTMINNYWFC